MLCGIVGLAAALRLRTVAEGVETRENAFFLRAVGVDYGQGFFWSKAVPGAITDLSATRRVDRRHGESWHIERRETDVRKPHGKATGGADAGRALIAQRHAEPLFDHSVSAKR